MCGIAGSTAADPTILAAMAERLAHRGPDGRGQWMAPEASVGLAHTRLAIIDLSAEGAQPMVAASGRQALAYNGEIYNYRALRAELERQGECFRSNSDTEVLLALLRREGVAALDRLVGMFAFAYWDGERGELLLARDRLGIKPLVYAPLGKGGLAFASEIRALRAHPGVEDGLDRRALSDYLACLYVPAPQTLYAGIRKLPPGHWLRWRKGAFDVQPWWRPRFERAEATPAGTVLDDLRQAVRDCLVADVEVGCFLSGGLDSGVIAALMAEAAREAGRPPPCTFTMTFTSQAYDEREAAAATARHLGCRHRELPAEPVLAQALPEMIAAFGEPFGNPTALLVKALSRAARDHVKVALVGDGGDEVFAGYPRYLGGLWAERYAAWVPKPLRRNLIAPLAQALPESQTGRHGWRRLREFLTAPDPAPERYASWVEYFSPTERRDLMGEATLPPSPIAEAYRGSHATSPLDAMQDTDLRTFLPGNLLAYGDAMSMAHALELRLPLLDHRLLARVAGMAPERRMADGKKTLLKQAAGTLLPASILNRPKIGFNPPMGAWLAGDLKPLVGELLTPTAMAKLGLAWKPVARLLAEKRRDNALKIWSLLVLAAWNEGRA